MEESSLGNLRTPVSPSSLEDNGESDPRWISNLAHSRTLRLEHIPLTSQLRSLTTFTSCEFSHAALIWMHCSLSGNKTRNSFAPHTKTSRKMVRFQNTRDVELTSLNISPVLQRLGLPPTINIYIQDLPGGSLNPHFCQILPRSGVAQINLAPVPGSMTWPGWWCKVHDLFDGGLSTRLRGRWVCCSYGRSVHQKFTPFPQIYYSNESNPLGNAFSQSVALVLAKQTTAGYELSMIGSNGLLPALTAISIVSL